MTIAYSITPEVSLDFGIGIKQKSSMTQLRKRGSRLLGKVGIAACHRLGRRGQRHAMHGREKAREVSDHTEFRVLALQLYDVYRESILGFVSKKGLAGEHIALVCPTLVST